MSDLIKKRDAIEALNAVDVYGDGIGFEVLSHAIRDVSLLPTVDAKPVRHGHWTVTRWFVQCSECGEAFPLTPTNYCPNCGAKMDAEEDEE